MKEFNKVPDIITGKDLEYFKDIFNWLFNIYKVDEDSLKYIEDKEINKLIINFNEVIYEYMNEILTLLESGGNNE